MRTLHIKNEDINYTFTFQVSNTNSIYKLYDEDGKKLISAIDNENGFDWIYKADICTYGGFTDMLVFMQCVKLCDNKLMGTCEIFENIKLMDL